MFTRILRFCLVLAFAVWQGGFIFYGGVVIPIGTRVLGSDLQQGFVTQSVSQVLNWIGVVCLLVWAAYIAVDSKTLEPANNISTIQRYIRLLPWLAWIGLAIGMLALFLLHFLMDLQLDSNAQMVRDIQNFKQLHRLYLGVSTSQWIVATALLWYSIPGVGGTNSDNLSDPHSSS